MGIATLQAVLDEMSDSNQPRKPANQSPANQPLPQKLLGLLAKVDWTRLSAVGLTLFSLGLILGLGFSVFQRTKVHKLTVAAGAAQGESYILSKAIETVVERHYPNIEMTVKETGGTTDNLKQLDNNQAQLATAQADAPASTNARIVSVLYTDKFQLVVQAGSKIQQFSDLRGKRIALPKKGGQYRSFLDVADHFGLQESDFTFVGDTEEAANTAFLNNQADAVFRVRAVGNPSLLKLVQTGQVRFVPIAQAAAMKIKHPAFEPSTIPQGAYRGSPAIPAEDLPTVAVQRTLLARQDVDVEAIRAITSVLTEQRQEIVDAIAPDAAEVKPLVASITRPSTETGLGVPLHPGAQAYYEKDKPSFIQEHADFVGLILTVLLLLGSWTWELKRIIERKQKNKGDDYNRQVITIMGQVEAMQTLQEVESAREALLNLLRRAVKALDEDRLSVESFQAFRVVWQIASDVVQAEQRQKSSADRYSTQVVHLMEQARASTTLNQIEAIRLDLLNILTRAVKELDENLISEESFQSFRAIWQIALDVLREQRVVLAQAQQRGKLPL